MPIGLLNQEAVPQGKSHHVISLIYHSYAYKLGLQPDMDPDVREALEALEIEDYIDEELDDQFFEQLNEENPLDFQVVESEEDDEDEEDWEKRFRR
jgi:protein LTV1